MERWKHLCNRLGLPPDEAQFQALWDAYHESGRHYHDWSHIEACLQLLNQIPEPLPERNILELALWFHDAVYDPRRGDNEARSNDRAQRFLAGHAALASRVESLILVTLHHGGHLTGSEAWMVDIDLAVLGAASDEYDVYEAAIRREYAWVPWFRYRSKRKAILRSFNERNPLYQQPYFQRLREEQAHANLARAIARL